MNAQYKKGVLELCVLSLLHLRDCYGYEISDFLSQHIEIADGTAHPAAAYLDGRPAGVLFCCYRVRPADHSRLLPPKSEAIPQICSPARGVGERSLSKVCVHAPHITNKSEPVAGMHPATGSDCLYLRQPTELESSMGCASAVSSTGAVSSVGSTPSPPENSAPVAAVSP